MKTRIAAILVAAAFINCQDQNLTWERMLTQHRVNRYQRTQWLPNNQAMQIPPQGTLPRHSADQPQVFLHGESNGKLAEQIPVETNDSTLAKGRELYAAHCAPCHGVNADGQSIVANFMTLQRPKSLREPPISEYPPGRVFQSISKGFRYMRSYQEISIKDRWAIVQYVKSLPASTATSKPGENNEQQR